MAIFPLKDVQNNDTLIRHTCTLYRLSLLKVLPFSLSIVVIYHLFRFGGNYSGQLHQPLMFIAVLCLPLFSLMVLLILEVGEQKLISLKETLMLALQRFLSLLACLISMILLPMIVLLLGIFAYFLLGHFFGSLPAITFFLLKIIIGAAIFLVLLPKILSPILIFSEGLDANTALDTSAQLVKMQWMRTFLFTLYGFSLLWFIAILPSLFAFYFKKMAINPLVMELIAEGLLVINLPWVVALLVMQAKDLYFRQALIENEKKGEKRKTVEIKSAKNNTLSF